MSRKVKWGILGCANIARTRTIPGLLQVDHAELYAVASRGKTKLDEFKEAFHPTVTYDNYNALLDDEHVEAVYIPLPNALHKEWVFKAADKGKHILCEKPLALNAEEAQEMFDYCKKKKVILMEAFAYRHSPLVQKAKTIANSGVIGKVKFVESHLTDMLEDMENIRMNQELGGGSFYDMACYNISLISYILDDDPLVVKAVQEKHTTQNIDLSNSTIMLYKDGVQAFSYSALNCYAKGGYTIVGERGRIDVPCNFNCRGMCKLIVTKDGVVSNVEVVDESVTEYAVQCPDNYMLEIVQMNHCILDGDCPLISEQETMRNIRIMDRIYADL